MSLATLEARSSREASATRLPIISVIVPVRNEAAHLRATLDQLTHQDYPPTLFEILVADGESTDETVAIVKEVMVAHPTVQLLANVKRWSSAGRNAAIRAARGDIILLIDGHCEIPNDQHLREVAAAFERSGAACLGRPQPLDISQATSLQRAIAWARSSRLGHHPASFIYEGTEGFVPPQSVAVAYRREVFDQLDGFDERFDACEDYEFNTRVAKAGLTCYFTPRLAIRYQPRGTLTGLFRQMTRYGRGRVRLWRKHPDSFSLPAFVPALFLLGVASGPLLASFWPWLWLAYGVSLSGYALALLVSTMSAVVQQRRLSLLGQLPLVYATIHAGAGWGVLAELLSTRSPRARG